MAKKEKLEVESVDEMIQYIEQSKIKPIEKEMIIEKFEEFESLLSEMELYKRSINKPYRFAYYLRRQIEMLKNSAKKNL
jgi:hypothetical protein